MSKLGKDDDCIRRDIEAKIYQDAESPTPHSPLPCFACDLANDLKSICDFHKNERNHLLSKARAFPILVEALEAIVKNPWEENALDPQWAARIAQSALREVKP